MLLGSGFLAKLVTIMSTNAYGIYIQIQGLTVIKIKIRKIVTTKKKEKKRCSQHHSENNLYIVCMLICVK